MYKIIALRILFVFVVVYAALLLLPENLNGFPYAADIKALYSMPHVITTAANFDGVHYVKIARDGYHQFDQAFFPLYPLLIAGLGYVLAGNHLLAGMFISMVSMCIGCYFLYSIMKNHYDKKKAIQFIILLLFFPTAFYLQMIYNEGLFLALLSGSLYFLYKKKFLSAGILAGLASLTRIHGIFLIIPFFFYFYDTKKSLKDNFLNILKSKWVILLSPLVGLFTYMAYLYFAYGNPLYFFTTQPSFGANRSTHLILLPQVYYRYLKIFITANFNFQYFVAVLEFIFFTTSFVASGFIGFKAFKTKNMFELSLAIFSLCYIILPTLTGTFSSIPRYSLFALAQYLAFQRIPGKLMQSLLLTTFIILHIILLSLFSRGYFVG